jgi:hypothetical protein
MKKKKASNYRGKENAGCKTSYEITFSLRRTTFLPT